MVLVLAYLSLGSNLGHRAHNLHEAIRRLRALDCCCSSTSTSQRSASARDGSSRNDRDEDLSDSNEENESTSVPLFRVTKTSFLYESEPMYFFFEARVLY
jgi:7,8-dihydro-6-hydroxymethylpterin-pyrophosphokinase